MHLVACAIPQEPLEHAPRTALLGDRTDGECWDGFWSADVYFVRCTRVDGVVQWYKLSDDDSATRVPVRESTNVLMFPTMARLQTRVVVAQSPNGRGMLVGTATRSAARSSRRQSK
jgi:hypothetical protein